MSRFTFVALVVLAAVFSVACGQSTTATTAPSVAPTATLEASGPPTPGISPAASMAAPTSSPVASAPSPPPSGAVAGSQRPSASGDDLSGFADLRQLIPDQVGGHALAKTLYTGADFEAFPASVSDQMRALLSGLQREVADLTMAVAADSTSTTDMTITAFRVRDVQADAFFDAYVPLVTGSFPNATLTEAVLGGKTVWDVSLDGQAAGTSFLYPRDDVLFIVTGTDVALVDLAFAALP